MTRICQACRVVMALEELRLWRVLITCNCWLGWYGVGTGLHQLKKNVLVFYCIECLLLIVVIGQVKFLFWIIKWQLYWHFFSKCSQLRGDVPFAHAFSAWKGHTWNNIFSRYMSTQWPCTFLFILKRSVNLIRDNQVGMYFIVENISNITLM